MAEELLRKAIDDAGLTHAFAVLDLDEFLGQIDQADAYDALANGSFSRFLESIVTPKTLPASWQKLADLGWSDDEVAGLVDGNLIKEDEATLVSAINMGALSRPEYNEFANYPNQGINVFFFTKNAHSLISWLQGKVVLPKIGRSSFIGE